MSRYSTLILFIAIVVGGGLAIGYLTAPGEWYAGLDKPSFNPPGWIFGPVWTLLYIAIALAGWWVWEHRRQSVAMKIWWIQLALNFIWSPVFFSAHQIGLALSVIVALLFAIIAFIVTTWERERAAAVMFIPYAAWVGFASVLNASIFIIN
ncbi:MAG: tryptophan-rich sensory protein [Planctomycetaceae bacterium]|nr:tryptophan-rich sensory protein [Planctomycetaceae bacterium]